MDREAAEGFYLSNGADTLGPIDTAQLMDEVASNRWGDACLAWRRPWTEWRSVEAIREVVALRAAQRSRGANWTPNRGWTPDDAAMFRLNRAAALMTTAADDMEVATMALRAAMQETRATVGLAHRTQSALGALETRAVIGLDVMGELGAVIDGTDAALRAARLGITILNVPQTSVVGSAAAKRLGGTERVSGVALVPIYSGTGLFAVLEMGKYGRPFRRSDRSWLRAMSRRASARLSKRAFD